MTVTRDTATYLYCLVQAARRPSPAGAPRGLPGLGPLRVVPAADDLWLIAADAPLAQYGGAPIERHLRDLPWVAVRGAAHARVVEHFARRLTTLPMKLFTLFAGEARAVAHVQRAEAGVRRVLARVEGCREWGIRVRRDPALARRRPRGRPSSAAPARRSGTGFLLARKQELDLARDALREGRAAVERAFDEMASLGEASRRRPAAELDGSPVVLDAALLVPARQLGAFKGVVRRSASDLAARGYRLTLSGPWPPYNFVGDGR
jgi:hypothetical protein